MWDLIVSVPDHCLSFYFRMIKILLLLAFKTDLGLKSVTSATILCRSVVVVWF